MDLIVWRVQTVAVDLLDLSSSTLLCLSRVRHNDQACGFRYASSRTSHGGVNEDSQLSQNEVYLHSNSGKTPPLSIPIVVPSTSTLTLEAKDSLRPSIITPIVLEQADSQSTQHSESGLRWRHRPHSPKYPPELRAFYAKTRQHMICIKSAKKLKQRLSSDSIRSRARLISTSMQPKNERQETHLRIPIPSNSKAKTSAAVFADEAQASNMTAGT